MCFVRVKFCYPHVGKTQKNKNKKTQIKQTKKENDKDGKSATDHRSPTCLAPVKYGFVCFRTQRRHYDLFIRLSFGLPFLLHHARSARQMSHSLSLEVMEIAEAAALLDRLASGLDEFPRRSTVPSSSAKERTEPPDRTCCWSLGTRHGET